MRRGSGDERKCVKIKYEEQIKVDYVNSVSGILGGKETVKGIKSIKKAIFRISEIDEEMQNANNIVIGQNGGRPQIVLSSKAKKLIKSFTQKQSQNAQGEEKIELDRGPSM